MDAVDRKIIALLENDSRISVTDLADEIPISISAASGTAEAPDPQRRDRPLHHRTRSGDDRAPHRRPHRDPPPRTDADSRDFDQAIRNMPSIVNATHLTGAADYQLRVLTRDVRELDELLSKLKFEFGVAETNTRLALRTVDGFPRLPSLG